MSTTATSLSSAQRVLRMLERRDHDRVPRYDGYWPETIARWKNEGLRGDGNTVLELLGSDFAGLYWCWPVPFLGQHEVLSEDEQTKVVRDSMGKVQRVWKDRWGTPEHVSFGCQSRGDWEATYKPALLKAGIQLNVAALLQQARKGQQREQFCVLQGIEAFEGMRQLVGDETLLVAFADEPEWVADMVQVYTDLLQGHFAAAQQLGVGAHAVWVFGDLGYNHGPFISPTMYRELIRPAHQRMCDWAHQQGMKFIYHTDGDVRPLLDDFVVAGFDCIQPMEAKAGMDVRKLAPIYGDKLSFFGNIDMALASGNERRQIELEVRSKLEAAMARRGYSYYSDHSVPPGVSWASYQYIIELLDRYGRYQ